jgi:hypothetical protein
MSALVKPIFRPTETAPSWTRAAVDDDDRGGRRIRVRRLLQPRDDDGWRLSQG